MNDYQNPENHFVNPPLVDIAADISNTNMP